MLVIFYVDVIFCQNFNLPHIYHISIFEMKIYKLITWYPNMVQYTFNFHKD
jgi:nicotinic acid mononucleotide adenylyltransferase